MALRKSKVNTDWSNNLAYVVGIITTDGNLSPDLRHINITSKDYEMMVNCRKCLNINNKIGRKARGKSEDKKYFALQFGDKNFFEFLLSIGLAPKKSKILKEISIPRKFFSDFFRGCIDGDGSLSISSHPESKHLQYTLRLYSASKIFLEWIYTVCKEEFQIEGGSISKIDLSRVYSLKFGKSDTIRILNRIYKRDVVCLSRKQEIAFKMLNIGRVA